MEEGKQDKLRKREKEEGKENKKKTEHNVTLGAFREEDKSLLALFFFFSRSCAVCFVTFTPLFVPLYVFLSWSLISFCSFFSFISVDQKQANKKPKWKKKPKQQPFTRNDAQEYVARRDLSS